MQPNPLVIGVFEFVLLLFSLSVHECAHAWTASRLGDQTARMLGRISLNPMDHVDPIGTLLIPGLAIFGPMIGLSFLSGFIFGWAKPVPIISRNFRNFRRDDTLVSLAGPASNLVLAFLAFLGLAGLFFAEGHMPAMATPSTTQQALEVLCTLALQLNLTLCIFNLIPIPPLDGSHILRHVLPYGAVQVFDKIAGIASIFLIIIVGRVVLGLLLYPILNLVYAVLNRI